MELLQDTRDPCPPILFHQAPGPLPFRSLPSLNIRTPQRFWPSLDWAGVISTTLGRRVRKGRSHGHEERPTSICRKAQPQFPAVKQEGQEVWGLLTPVQGQPRRGTGRGRTYRHPRSRWDSPAPAAAPRAAAGCGRGGSRARAGARPPAANSPPGTWGPAWDSRGVVTQPAPPITTFILRQQPPRNSKNCG